MFRRRFIQTSLRAAADAKRGERKLQLEAVDRLRSGNWVRLTMSDPPRGSDSAGSLVSHLYQGLRLCILRPHARAIQDVALPDLVNCVLLLYPCFERLACSSLCIRDC